MSTGIDQLVYALTEGQDEQHPKYGHYYGNCCGDYVQDLCDDAAGEINDLRARLERIEREVRELADSWEKRPKHAQWCARKLRAIVDTGRDETGKQR